MTIPLSAAVDIPEHILTRQLDDELVILDLESERYFGLDDVGTRMWQTLTTTDSVGSALDCLQEEYDADPKRLRGDLEDLLDQLVEQRLIRVTNATGEGDRAQTELE